MGFIRVNRFKPYRFYILLWCHTISLFLLGDFSGFGFSASSVSLLSFIFSCKRNSTYYSLLLEIIASLFMIPSIWKKINWKFVLYLLLGVLIGTPFGIHLLTILDPNITHLIISLTVLIFAFLLLKGYKNKNLNHNLSKFFVGGVAGTVNGFGTLAGLPIALYFLIIAAEPAVIRASLAALFFFTDFYALLLAYFENILNYTVILRTLPLIFIIPIGVF